VRTLRKAERCPLHNSYACVCHKGPSTKPTPPKAVFVRGVKRIEDPFHPRGFREEINAQEKKRRKYLLLTKGKTCFYCGQEFTRYDEIELCHKEPKGFNGARHDDHMTNLCLGHRSCNQENGSKRPAA
jgi:hypothetical protein